MPDNPRQAIFNSILATVGNTPVVRLNALVKGTEVVKPGVRAYRVGSAA